MGSASQPAANRCWDISTLKPVPRTPKWPSATNGIETAARAISATGAQRPRPSRRPDSRSAAKAPAAIAATSSTISAVKPWPGRRTAHQARTLAAARPMTAEVGDHLRAPAAARIPDPIAVETTITSRAAA